MYVCVYIYIYIYTYISRDIHIHFPLVGIGEGEPACETQGAATNNTSERGDNLSKGILARLSRAPPRTFHLVKRKGTKPHPMNHSLFLT